MSKAQQQAAIRLGLRANERFHYIEHRIGGKGILLTDVDDEAAAARERR